MQPKISVIVPVYNVESYLPRCLDSILAQTYEHLEIICVNDGSPDNSLAILEQYAARDARIKVITRKNGGIAVARNTGLDAATGELIMFVDSDDFLKPHMAETLLHSLKEHNADIVNCQFADHDSSGNTWKKGYSYSPIICGQDQALWLLLKDKQVTNHVWRNLYKRTLFQDIRFPEGKVFEDIIVMPQIFLKAEKFVFLSEELYYYFTNKNSIVHSPSYKQRKDYFDAFNHTFAFVKNKIPSLFERYIPIYIQKMLLFRNELLTCDRQVDKDETLCQAVERKLKPLLSAKLFREHTAIFFKILLMGISRPVTLKLRAYRIFRYKIILMFCTGRKRQHYLNKLQRESW